MGPRRDDECHEDAFICSTSSDLKAQMSQHDWLQPPTAEYDEGSLPTALLLRRARRIKSGGAGHEIPYRSV